MGILKILIINSLLKLKLNFFLNTKASFNKYQSNKSITYVPNGSKISIGYFDSTFTNGFLSQDTLRINSMTILNQTFAEAREFDNSTLFDVVQCGVFFSHELNHFIYN